MTLGLLLLLSPVHAQEALEGAEVIIEVAPGQTGTILLDGRDTGETAPGILSGVMPGEHRIQVRGDCLLGMGFVTVVPGQLARVTIDLQTTGGFVEVSVVPPSAEIVIDGELAGKGPSVGTELSCGPHRILVRHPEHGAQAREIRVEMGAAQSLTLDLTLPPPLPPEPVAPPKDDRAGLRKGLGIGLAALGVGAIGGGAWIYRSAHQDYRSVYVPDFEACGDLVCQEDLQIYRQETLARQYYGGMIVAAAGAVSLTTAGVVGLTSDGYPVLGLTRRW
jgi:hypothetical protein